MNNMNQMNNPMANPMYMQQMQQQMMMNNQPIITGPTGGTPINAIRRNIQPSQPTQPIQQNQRVENESDNNSTIRRLASDINKGLDDYVPSRKVMTETETENIETDEMPKKIKRGYIPEWLKEPLLLLVIYVILSFGFVKKTIGNYIVYINPGSDGYVSWFGILIYGIILTGSYTLFKRLFI